MGREKPLKRRLLGSEDFQLERTVDKPQLHSVASSTRQSLTLDSLDSLIPDSPASEKANPAHYYSAQDGGSDRLHVHDAVVAWSFASSRVCWCDCKKLIWMRLNPVIFLITATSSSCLLVSPLVSNPHQCSRSSCSLTATTGAIAASF